MNKQENILRDIAEKHGIKIGAAKEIEALFWAKIADTIESTEAMTDGFYDPEKVPVIHIENFGKFKPDFKGIKKLNKAIEVNNKKNL